MKFFWNQQELWSGRGDLNARPPAPKANRVRLCSCVFYAQECAIHGDFGAFGAICTQSAHIFGELQSSIQVLCVPAGGIVRASEEVTVPAVAFRELPSTAWLRAVATGLDPVRLGLAPTSATISRDCGSLRTNTPTRINFAIASPVLAFEPNPKATMIPDRRPGTLGTFRVLRRV